MIIHVSKQQWIAQNKQFFNEEKFESLEQFYQELGKYQVLKSNAGYYVGRLSADGLPYNRETDYYSTREQAEFALEVYYMDLAEEIARGEVDPKNY